VPQEASPSAWACEVCAQVRLTRCDSLKPTLSFCDRNFLPPNAKTRLVDYLASYSRDILGFFPGVERPGPEGKSVCGAVLPYSMQQCSVKHDIHLINIFIDLGLHVSIH